MSYPFRNQRSRISLLFNANKVYDRQVIEGVGEYLQASQCDWDIFIEEDFHYRIENIQAYLGDDLGEGLGDGVIADFDEEAICEALSGLDIPIVGVGGSYHNINDYPPVNYIATDNHALVEIAFNHLKEKGLKRFAFYGLPESSKKRWAQEREHAFREIARTQNYQINIYQGLETALENWQYAQNRLADWIQTLPPQTGIIAVTDARARYILQVCEYLNISVPEKLCVIGIDNEEITRYLSRISLSSVMQSTRQIGYQAAKVLDQLLKDRATNAPASKLQRIIVPPVKVFARSSTDFRSLNDPAVIQAMHYIRFHACSNIKVEQVLDAVGLSRSNLEKRFKNETGQSIHFIIHQEKFERAKNLLISTSLSINEIATKCGYPSLQYFYSVFKKECDQTPKAFREQFGEMRY